MLPAISTAASALMGLQPREYPAIMCNGCGQTIEFRGPLPPSQALPAGWLRVETECYVTHFCAHCKATRHLFTGQAGRRRG